MMCAATDNPASCEIRFVVHCLHAKDISVAEIHRELRAVYGRNVMSEGTVRQCCRIFKDGQSNFPDEERSGRPSVVSDYLVQNVDPKICERRHFTIS
jgi:hypothetical protein